MRDISPQQIDDLLPQTQCGLCGYGGCMPYAKGIVFDNAPINLCPPGGVSTLRAMAELLNQDCSPYMAEMEKAAKPKKVAVIRETECIGCTKCIQACPVDAILGSAKKMHTVIANECTGCELCISPCPVDCIDLIPLTQQEVDQATQAKHARIRFNARQKRLAKEKAENTTAFQHTLIKRKQYIQAAVMRAKGIKTIKSILKQADLTPEELEQCLK